MDLLWLSLKSLVLAAIHSFQNHKSNFSPGQIKKNSLRCPVLPIHHLARYSVDKNVYLHLFMVARSDGDSTGRRWTSPVAIESDFNTTA